MSSLTATLAKPVGPMPLGAWLLVGAGGLYIASRKAKGGGEGETADPGDGLPTGGGLGPTAGGLGSFDGAPVILQPIFNIPGIPAIPPKTTTPIPRPTPAPPTNPGPLPPRVPGGHAPRPTGPRPTPKPVISYTIKKGDTLWAIASRYLGAGVRWPSIYAQNKATIDTKARAMGKPGGGHWIYPGTVLRFTK